MSRGKNSPFAIEARYFIYLIPLVIGLLAALHVFLFAVIMIKNSELFILSSKWNALAPQRQALDKFKSEFAVINQDSLAINQLVAQRINWSEKLNKLSLGLPSGVWFEEITISKNNFFLRGSVVSLQRQEMSLIKSFMDNLKNENAFIKDFNKLELGSVQRRTVGGYEIADFSFSGSLRQK
ncbi:MAG TPA: hypothetical protein VMD04_02295 [Candidatus Margulisiibacteriota bacterium]|nr:hypothetical protein [Candidatus Margulisiibacteriota bacterium]